MNLLLKNIWIIPLVILFLFRDSIFGIGGDDSGDDTQGGKDTGRTDVGDEGKDVSDATLTDTQAESIATDLYIAMRSAGTDEYKIYSSFRKIKNESDYNLVHNKFGYRQRSDGFGNDGMPWGIDPQVDLMHWLKDELDHEEWQKLVRDNPKLNLI